MAINSQVQRLKELFCSNILLSDDSFKPVYNYMLSELQNNPSLYNFDITKIRFNSLCDNTLSKFPNIDKEEINKISLLFAGFYNPNGRVFNSYSILK